MSKLNISLRLRPTRFGFLVDPNDKETLLKIFQTNTCLWGGQYNPIIPCYKHLPQCWWNRVHEPKNTNAQSVVEQYIDFFEPDLLVVSQEIPYKNFRFDPNRIIKLQDLLTKSNGQGGYGLQMHLIYDHLFKGRFQFFSRNEASFISLKPSTISDKLLWSCLTGMFPDQIEFNYFEKSYKVHGKNWG